MSYLPASANPAAQSLVLIAEDEAEIAEILAAYLQRHGLRTLHAADGREALAMHQTCKPDLLLLDVQMPQLDGWQVLSEIRARGDTPVIMLTALDQDLDKLMGLRMGADDYVVKPFNPAEVVARVQAVLRRSQAAKQTTARAFSSQAATSGAKSVPLSRPPSSTMGRVGRKAVSATSVASTLVAFESL